MMIIERLAFIESSFPASTLPTIFASPYTKQDGTDYIVGDFRDCFQIV